jgi:acetyl esterase/lipase
MSAPTAAILIGLALALLVVAVARQWWMLRLSWRLYRARRESRRFYATCPWLRRNIAYNPPSERRLDVYRPERGSGHPVIFYVYGGSWTSGNKELYAPAAERLVPAGFVLVVPDYTLHPAAGYPQQTAEIGAALAWSLEHAAEFGGDPRRLVVVVQSAGAQVGGLALLEPRWLAAHGHGVAEVRGFLSISGALDVEAVYAFHADKKRAQETMAAVFGGRQNFAAASPINYIRPGLPPIRLIHGDADRVVPLSVSEAFVRRARAAGVPCELLIYVGGGHGEILLRALVEQPPRLFDDILAFARRCTDMHEPAPKPNAMTAAIVADQPAVD